MEKVLTFDDDLFKFVLSFLLWSKFENDEHFQDRYIPSRLHLVIVMIEIIMMKVTVMLKLISLGLKNISCVGFKS